jgi:succinate dehydrogenase/fumarate reductase flavoprotein subunit
MAIGDKILTDVLVIGGGGAGARAALEAAKAGSEVILVDKGDFGKSGSTSHGVAEVAGFNVADAVIDPDDSTEEHFRDILAAALGTCHPKLAGIVAEEASTALRDLEEFGVAFEKADTGKYVEVKGCFASRPRMHIIKGHGIPIIRALSGQLGRTDVKILNQTRVIDLLVHDGICLGGLCLDSRGDRLVIQSKSTILTAGGAGQIFRYNLNPPEITGDGYALGWRAGAKLINMEFMQSGVGMVHPFTSMLSAWLWEGRPRLYNERNDDILIPYVPPGTSTEDCIYEKRKHMPFSSRDISRFVDIAIQAELTGREKENGRVYLDFTSVASRLQNLREDSDFRSMWRVTKDWMLDQGLDLTVTPFPVACFGHAINGGLLIDEHGETSIRNLFAAGGVAGGPHGADRLGGNMLVTCQIFGKRAGQRAAQRSKEARGQGNGRLISRLVKRLDPKNEPGQALERDRELLEVKKAIKDLLWRNYLVVKTGDSLDKCIEGINALREMTRDEKKLTGTLLDIRNMLETAQIMVLAAQERRESRGSHYRADFPAIDPQWQQSLQFWREGNQVKKEAKNFSNL